jgi:hypothetical protein
MLAFDAAGAVRWTVQGDEPAIATADGGVIGKSGIAYDAAGSAIWQTGLQIGDPRLAGNAQPSWGAQAYSFGPGGVSQDYIWFEYASSFGVVPGGNPSGYGTFVENAGLAESDPLWNVQYSSEVTSCSLGSSKPLLFPGQPNNPYASAKATELAFLAGLPKGSTCEKFMSSGNRLQYWLFLGAALTNQVAYDGIGSNISLLSAGAYSKKDKEDNYFFPKYYEDHPVCDQFLKSTRQRYYPAMAQAYPPPGKPATDVYVDSRDWIIQHLTPSDVLHEALHNLTQLNDADLYMLLTGDKLKGLPSSVISKALRDNGCAPAR